MFEKMPTMSQEEHDERAREAEEALGKSEKVEVNLGFEFGDKVILEGDNREWTVISGDSENITIGLLDEKGDFEITKSVNKEKLKLQM